MLLKRMFGLTCLCLLLAACSQKVAPPCTLDPQVLEKIKIDPNSPAFTTDSGKTFMPWGFNYTRTEAFGLIEDGWDNEANWTIIEEDFREMSCYGANVVRVHLQFNKFMDAADSPSVAALEKLERLVKVAEQSNLYLDITGLSAYRKTDQPSWYDEMSEVERWASHAVFWEAIAKTVKDSPAVFAYNLMNEPIVAVDPVEDWLFGDGLGGFHFVQYVSQDANGRNPTDVMKAWIDQQYAAIRKHDSSTLITVGFLSLGPVARFEDNLDYLSMHLYPKKGLEDDDIEKVRASQTSKPLVLEETFPLNTGIAEMEDFVAESQPMLSGVISHYDGDTIEDLTAKRTIAAAIRRDWLKAFNNLNPNK